MTMLPVALVCCCRCAFDRVGVNLAPVTTAYKTRADSHIGVRAGSILAQTLHQAIFTLMGKRPKSLRPRNPGVVVDCGE
jgi:hypothetical protein